MEDHFISIPIIDEIFAVFCFYGQKEPLLAGTLTVKENKTNSRN
jgi:hypothetical protein